ncbi:MAG: Bud site selection protein 6 [Thelocarpon impressellum]|nr:MAG: Bud site selection protein 6 [Thelocarpon impressellum]
MQASSAAPQRPRRTATGDANPASVPPQPPATPSGGSQSLASTRNSSGSTKSGSYRRANPSQQLSQIEKSVTHLLVATKQLLETLTQWSRHNATEAEVSDVYVRLGYEFNIASRAFNAIGVDTADLGNVPDLLRAILEDTLSQEASPPSLDRYLPRIRDIIINLLHGLKRKQQKLRQRQSKDDGSPSTGPMSRQDSTGSTASGESGLTQMLEEQPMRFLSNGSSSSQSIGRTSSRESSVPDESGIPPRVSSVPGGRASPLRQDAMGQSSSRARSSPSHRNTHISSSTSSSSMSSNTMQNIPVIAPFPDDEPSSHREPPPEGPPTGFPHPPPPPPKQQDALAALQRGGDLERRASRRYSAYQISKHLGASANGVPMLPPAQYTPIPNRGRDVRESMNAVRTRGSASTGQQRLGNRSGTDTSPGRESDGPQRLSGQIGQDGSTPASRAVEERTLEPSPMAKTPEGKLGPPSFASDAHEAPVVAATLQGPPIQIMPAIPNEAEDADRGVADAPRTEAMVRQGSQEKYARTSPTAENRQFIPEQSPQPGKELTLFLQYKSKIKKFVLPDGYNDLTVARLQLAFIEKFAWNTHSNGIDLPEIYIQDPVSGVRHELEDLSDVKDRSVLVLNVEALDEVKKHIDEGLGGLKQILEGVKGTVDGQHITIQRVSDRQQDTSKEIARLAAAPAPANAKTARGGAPNGIRASLPSSVDSASHLTEIQSLRRDLAVMRQTYSNFVSDVETSMAAVRAKASSVKTVAINAAIPTLDGETGRAYVNKGKKDVGEVSDGLVNKVDDLQDIVEDLRKDVVTRGVRPLPRQLENVGRDISLATAELKKMQEFLRREKPKWSKIWEKELQVVCDDRDLLTMQEALATDLQDDLDNAAQTFALVEEATKEQMKDGQGAAPRAISSRGLNAIAVNSAGDPHQAKEGVLGEVRALQPNHENRLEAIERAEKARQKELESRRGGEFQKELGSFVEEGRLKKSGGVEEAERLRKLKDERTRKEVWERQNARAQAKEAAKAAKAAKATAPPGPERGAQAMVDDAPQTSPTPPSGDAATAEEGQQGGQEGEKLATAPA